MEPFATSPRGRALVQKVGQVPIVAKELVTINSTALDALKSARARPTTPNCMKLAFFSSSSSWLASFDVVVVVVVGTGFPDIQSLF